MEIIQYKWEIVCLMLFGFAGLRYYNYLTWHKACLAVAIFLSLFWKNWNPETDFKVPLGIIGLICFFINSRIVELIKATGIVNAVLHKYVILKNGKLFVKEPPQVNKIRDQDHIIRCKEIVNDIKKYEVKLVEHVVHHNALIELLNEICILYHNQYQLPEIKTAIENYKTNRTSIFTRWTDGFTFEELLCYKEELQRDVDTNLQFVNTSKISSPKLKRCKFLLFELFRSF